MGKYVSVVVSILVALAVSAWGGYTFRDVKCSADASATRLEVADALALLARQYTAADARFREEKRKRLSEDGLHRELGKNEIQKLVDHSCGWTFDERVILQRSYCQAFPAAPACHMP